MGNPDASSLTEVLPAELVITDPARMDSYRRDAAHLAYVGTPAAVVTAASTRHVADTLAWASAHRVPVVPRGAGSGLSGGAAALDGCVVLSTAGMTAIKEIADEDLLAVVEPGVLNGAVGRAAAAVGLFYPPDPSSFEISSIGGNLATNAGASDA